MLQGSEDGNAHSRVLRRARLHQCTGARVLACVCLEECNEGKGPVEREGWQFVLDKDHTEKAALAQEDELGFRYCLGFRGWDLGFQI